MMAGSAPVLQLQGERRSGQDVRTQNITAVAAIANIVKSSLGPVGLDKVRHHCRAKTARLSVTDGQHISSQVLVPFSAF